MYVCITNTILFAQYLSFPPDTLTRTGCDCCQSVAVAAKTGSPVGIRPRLCRPAPPPTAGKFELILTKAHSPAAGFKGQPVFCGSGSTHRRYSGSVRGRAACQRHLSKACSHLRSFANLCAPTAKAAAEVAVQEQ